MNIRFIFARRSDPGRSNGAEPPRLSEEELLALGAVDAGHQKARIVDGNSALLPLNNQAHLLGIVVHAASQHEVSRIAQACGERGAPLVLVGVGDPDSLGEG